jgi:hypothetical protein
VVRLFISIYKEKYDKTASNSVSRNKNSYLDAKQTRTDSWLIGMDCER